MKLRYYEIAYYKLRVMAWRSFHMGPSLVPTNRIFTVNSVRGCLCMSTTGKLSSYYNI
ncbi:hypothetical protein HanPI659440_Chr02g0090811 [Helianthus annuus]|nr:hypothetical protein HanPI659440_Chr02g0090811 [Helianthus annuus]